MKQVSESEIKAELLTYLRRRGVIGRRAVLANELRLGTTPVRADLAVFNGRLIGVEVKGPADSLRRLEKQIAAYKLWFDDVILVVAERHLAKLNWTDLTGVEVLKVDQKCRISTLGPSDLSPDGKREAAVPLEGRTSAFADRFKARFQESSNRFWDAVGRRKVQPEDLSHLSLFKDRREREARFVRDRELSWQTWDQRAAAVFGSQSDNLTKN